LYLYLLPSWLLLHSHGFDLSVQFLFSYPFHPVCFKKSHSFSSFSLAYLHLSVSSYYHSSLSSLWTERYIFLKLWQELLLVACTCIMHFLNNKSSYFLAKVLCFLFWRLVSEVNAKTIQYFCRSNRYMCC
jgi:hypothetical protein